MASEVDMMFAAAAREPGNFSALCRAGDLARSAGQWESACSYYEAALALDGTRGDVRSAWAEALQRLGRNGEAEARLKEIPRGAPQFFGARLQLGDLLLRANRAGEAWEALLEAGEDSADSRPHILLGRMLRARGDLAGAAARYDAALKRQPGMDIALSELGEVKLEQGDLAAAIGLLERASSAQPANPAVSFHLALARFRAGNWPGAITELERAGGFAPDDRNIQRLAFEAYILLNDESKVRAMGRRLLDGGVQDAKVMREMLPLAEGKAEYDTIISRLHIICKESPGDARNWRLVARNSLGAADYDRCMQIFDEGLSLHDSGTLRLAQALTLPKLPRSIEQIDRVRAATHVRLDALINGDYKVADVAKDVGQTAFHLAYHGLNDRDLQKKYATAHLAVAPYLAWTAPHLARPRAPGGRIRIGFISRYLARHAVGGLIAGIIRALNRERFEVVLVHIPGSRDDFTDALDREVSGSINLPNQYAAARTAIANLELDILFYTDIGIEPFSYYLAFSRLARVQAVWPGHPVTTGIPAMDVFFSSLPPEPDNAPLHYSERLIRLQRLPIFGQPRAPRVEVLDLQLPAGRKIYALPNSIYKFHPGFDRILARIMAADPAGTLVIIGGKDPWYNMLYERLHYAIPGFANRIVLLPFLDKRHFFSLLRSADAILDTIHFSGGNTSVDAFSAGVAPVTLEGRFMRSRTTSGMYRQVGLPEFITTTEDEYVARALRTANDPTFRTQAGAAVLERTGALFNDPLLIEDLESYFNDLVAAAS